MNRGNEYPKKHKIKKVTGTGALMLDARVAGQNIQITEVAHNRWEVIVVTVKPDTDRNQF